MTTLTALVVKINNVTYPYLAGTCNVNGAIGQISSAQFTVMDGLHAWHFYQGMPVAIYDNLGNKVYGGFVDTSDETIDSYTTMRLHAIVCNDGHYLTSKRRVAKAYSSMTCGAMVKDIVVNYLAAEGIIGRDFAITDTLAADFNLGTLVRTIGTTNNSGDLELATAPGAPTYARSSIAYGGGGGVSLATNVPRYVTGANGSALFIEESTTNLVSANQSDIEGGSTSGFSALSSATLTADGTQHYYNNVALKTVTTTTSGSGASIASIAATAGQAYTASAWVWAASAITVKFTIKDNTNSLRTDVVQTLTANTWQRLTASLTYGASSGTGLSWQITNNAATAITFFMDGLQIEALSYATTWHPGGQTRSTETLQIPSAGLPPVTAGGTIEQIVYITANSLRQISGQLNLLFQLTNSSGGLDVYHADNQASWFVRARNDSGAGTFTNAIADSYTPVGWHYFTYTWSGVDNAGQINFYIDGVLRGTLTTAHMPSAFSGCYIGGQNGFAVLDAYHDCVKLSGRAKTASEIAAAYTSWSSGTALAVDRDTTYIAQFDTSLAYGYGGYRLSPKQSINQVGLVLASAFTYHTTAAAGQTVTIDLSYDGGTTWQSPGATGAALPSITAGMDLSQPTAYSLVVRQSILTTDTTITPAPYVADVGFTLTTSQIQAGQTVTATNLNYVAISNVFDQFATVSNYWWSIDQYNRLFFQVLGTQVAPFAITSVDMEGGSVDVKNVTPNYRNRQYIRNIGATTATQTETRKGDGTTTTFTMSFPLASVPTITLNGSAQTVGIKGVDTGKNWYWAKGDPIIAQDTAGTHLLTTDSLQTVYNGQFIALVQVDDMAGQVQRQTLEGGATTGIVEDVYDFPQGTDTTQGFQLANGFLQKFSINYGKIVTFDTLLAGLAPGQLLTVTAVEHDIVAVPMLVESVAINDSMAGNDFLVPQTITAIVGPADTTWVQFFTDLLTRNTNTINQINLGASGSVIVAVPEAESWTWTEAVSESVFTCPICGPSLICGPGVIVC